MDQAVDGGVGGQAAGDADVGGEAGAEAVEHAAREARAGRGGREARDGDGGVGGGVGEELAAGAVIAHRVRHAEGRGAADGGVVLVRADGGVGVAQLSRGGARRARCAQRRRGGASGDTGGTGDAARWAGKGRGGWSEAGRRALAAGSWQWLVLGPSQRETWGTQRPLALLGGSSSVSRRPPKDQVCAGPCCASQRAQALRERRSLKGTRTLLVVLQFCGDCWNDFEGAVS